MNAWPAAAVYALYLLVPTLILLSGPLTAPRRPPLRELATILLLWLPIEFRLLPRLPGPGGVDLTKFPGFAAALVLFLVVRKLPDVGFTFALRRRDVGVAVAVFAIYAVAALPLGFSTGFIEWNPRVTVATTLLQPLLIYFLIALPEEFLFRGLIQNLLARWWGRRWALPVAAVVFGLAHLPDPRYVVLATLAGVAYGVVYDRTTRVTASAVTHALVDWLWVLLLRAGTR